MNENDEILYKIIGEKFGYNQNELDSFKNNRRNRELIGRAKEFDKKLFVLEIVASKGCNSNHKVGDKFYFDYAGNILTKRCPPKICGYALNSAMMMIFTANEMLYAGVDPNGIRFKRASCFDVGIECGGWGRIVLELKVEENVEGL